MFIIKRKSVRLVRPWKTSEGRLARELKERMRMKGQESGIMREKGKDNSVE